jgi:hypothetical protein
MFAGAGTGSASGTGTFLRPEERLEHLCARRKAAVPAGVRVYEGSPLCARWRRRQRCSCHPRQSGPNGRGCGRVGRAGAGCDRRSWWRWAGRSGVVRVARRCGEHQPRTGRFRAGPSASGGFARRTGGHGTRRTSRHKSSRRAFGDSSGRAARGQPSGRTHARCTRPRCADCGRTRHLCRGQGLSG